MQIDIKAILSASEELPYWQLALLYMVIVFYALRNYLYMENGQKV